MAAACVLAMIGAGLSSWVEQRQLRAESELHGTWLPLVEATGDLKSDLDAWQAEPVPLLAERVEARLKRIEDLATSSSELGGPTETAPLLADVRARWQALQSGHSTDWDGLHGRLRDLGLTGLAQSERLARIASGSDA
jgi:hypothetical protein